MLDIKFIRENADKVKDACSKKGIDANVVDQLLEWDLQRRELVAGVDALRAAKNAVSLDIAKMSADEKASKLLEMKEVDSRQTEMEAKLREVQKQFDALMLQIPNIPAPEVPVGKDDSGNIPWRYWSVGTGAMSADDPKVSEVPTKFDFEVKDHAEIGVNLNLMDLEAGVKTAGFRGYYLKNELVLMHYGLMMHALEKLRAKGFTLMATPTIVREFALQGAGMLPQGREEIYQVAEQHKMGEDVKSEAMFLAGTSEPSLIAYYADKILEEKELPIQVCGVSPCYRSEIGSYGKDTKGLYRVHEFMKVEQVVVCKAEVEESERLHEALREIAEEMLQDLKLPYRVIHVCTGDMGMGKYKMYDIETWMPARKNYGETHSDSNLTDWQARRLNIRYRDSKGEVKYAFTLNNTAVASPRILIAILENYQQADGSVKVPEILQKYVGSEVIKKN